MRKILSSANSLFVLLLPAVIATFLLVLFLPVTDVKAGVSGSGGRNEYLARGYHTEEELNRLEQLLPAHGYVLASPDTEYWNALKDESKFYASVSMYEKAYNYTHIYILPEDYDEYIKTGSAYYLNANTVIVSYYDVLGLDSPFLQGATDDEVAGNGAWLTVIGLFDENEEQTASITLIDDSGYYYDVTLLPINEYRYTVKLPTGRYCLFAGSMGTKPVTADAGVRYPTGDGITLMANDSRILYVSDGTATPPAYDWTRTEDDYAEFITENPAVTPTQSTTTTIVPLPSRIKGQSPDNTEDDTETDSDMWFDILCILIFACCIVAVWLIVNKERAKQI